MSDLIRRKSIKNLLCDLNIDNISINGKHILEYIDELPTVDAVSVVRGKWLSNGIPGSVLSKCSVCGCLYGSSSFNFCPECGAAMREENK